MKKLFAVLAVVAVLVALFVAPVGAANYTNVTGSANAFNSADAAGAYVVAGSVNFTTTPVAANDVVQLVQYPGTCVVEYVVFEMTTTNATVDTYGSLGDGNLTNRWVDVIDCDTAGALKSASNGVMFAASDTIDFKAGSAVTGGVLRVRAAIRDMRK